MNRVKKILNDEKIKYNILKKSESGFSNLVYFIDDSFVIKILEPTGNAIKFNNEIGFYKSMDFDFMSNYIASGEYKGTQYLIIEKLQGQSLYDVWHTISQDERETITIQVATILKQINRELTTRFLHQESIREDLVTLYKNAFDTNISILENKGYDIDFLRQYAKERVPIIFEECKCGIVYNDAHFDNFIYDGKTVRLIDFDRVLYTSIDYELLILHTMVNNPKKFANEKVEPYVKIKDYQDVLPMIKQVYPELFDFKFLDERLYIYSFFYTLGNIYAFNLYDLLPKILNDFKVFISNQKHIQQAL
ncbi:MAG: aminoglycoside phosphotransferase family protein [Candidatus Izemoplasmataceae bacterium]